MMATTMRSSTSVKPRWLPNRRCPSRTMVAPPLLKLRSTLLRGPVSAGGVPQPWIGSLPQCDGMLEDTGLSASPGPGRNLSSPLDEIRQRPSNPGNAPFGSPVRRREDPGSSPAAAVTSATSSCRGCCTWPSCAALTRTHACAIDVTAAPPSRRVSAVCTGTDAAPVAVCASARARRCRATSRPSSRPGVADRALRRRGRGRDRRRCRPLPCRGRRRPGARRLRAAARRGRCPSPPPARTRRSCTRPCTGQRPARAASSRAMSRPRWPPPRSSSSGRSAPTAMRRTASRAAAGSRDWSAPRAS